MKDYIAMDPSILQVLKTLSVLYVEDDRETREELAMILEPLVRELHLAADGQAGLELFKQKRPDLVVTDIQMPRLSGLAMGGEIRRLVPGQPIIVVSAYNDVDYLFRAIELGIDQYITKPVNVERLLQKLAQVAAGAVYTDTKEVVQFDIRSRLRELLDIIDSTDHKVLVFVPFRHISDVLKEEITKHLNDPNAVEVIRGGVSAGARADIIKRFQTEDATKVLLLAPAATAHGITLTRADQVVWWGPITSTEMYLQANSRAHRAGQRNCVTVTHLQGSPVERRMYAMLQNKVDLHMSLVDLYKQEIS